MNGPNLTRAMTGRNYGEATRMQPGHLLAGESQSPPLPGSLTMNQEPISDRELRSSAPHRVPPATDARSGCLVLSVAETAEALGISDDLVYELMHRGILPCLHFGRRKLIPRRAIDLVIGAAMRDFDPADLLATLSARGADRD